MASQLDKDFPYSVVVTLAHDSPKSKVLNVYVAPTKWIKNNILYYPSQKPAVAIQAFVKLGHSAPGLDDSWSRFACKIKKRFNSFDAADKFVSANQLVESDNDDGTLRCLQQLQLGISEPKKSVSNKSAATGRKSQDSLFGNSSKPESSASISSTSAAPVPQTLNVSKIESEFKKCHESITSMKLAVDKMEQNIVALEKKIDEKFTEIGQKVDDSNTIIIEFINASNKELMKTVQDYLLRHSAMLAHNVDRQHPIPLMARKNQTKTSSSIEMATNAVISEAELEKEEVDIDPTQKINTIDELEKFETSLLSRQVFEHYTAYYTSILEQPVLPADIGHDEKNKINRTLLYSISNELFGKYLFANQITWSGNSPHGPRLRFAKFENLLKWTHYLMMQYDSNITLDFIKDFYQTRICKTGKQRMLQLEARRSTGRNFHNRKRKTGTTGVKQNSSVPSKQSSIDTPSIDTQLREPKEEASIEIYDVCDGNDSTSDGVALTNSDDDTFESDYDDDSDDMNSVKFVQARKQTLKQTTPIIATYLNACKRKSLLTPMSKRMRRS